ncbi:hypothetical protein HYFRA_00003587 [Hymenoscyphus fraxineus]|uniref:Uncharacterized protein n=1 Tax=Hymenoscyphus fraxineus TaxID=746836 RepID=A0A9N9L277_9HELO|nr:hypothetical protein HYFRA_00003587 [Hymenoscyphus fraxineus]
MPSGKREGHGFLGLNLNPKVSKDSKSKSSQSTKRRSCRGHGNTNPCSHDISQCIDPYAKDCEMDCNYGCKEERERWYQGS